MVSTVRRIALALAAAAAVLVASCATGSTTDPQTREPAGGATPAGSGTTAKTDVSALQGYVNLAREKLDQGAIAEGIQNFVTVLSELSRAATVSSEAKQLGATAEEELNRIGSGMNLAASNEWMDEAKNQIAASTLDVGTPRALGPAVTLTFSYGGTRTVVAGAPVVFEFVKGAGSLVSPVTTNEFGQANTTVASLDSVKAENVIRATVVFRAGGFSYTFREVSRDFAYTPPVRKATIVSIDRAVMEGGEIKTYPNPRIAAPVFNALKEIDFAFSQSDGALMGEAFTRVLGGDNGAIRSLGLEDGVSYLVIALKEAANARQVELNGMKFDMYTSRGGRAITRIIRIADRVEVYSATLDAVQGQGNTVQKAIDDGFAKTAEKMAERLRADLAEISRKLLGN